MKRKRYSDEQIAFALRQAENGTLVEEVCRKLGVSEATFYQFAGMGVVEIRRLKQLEEENAKLKRLVADLSQAEDRSQALAGNDRSFLWLADADTHRRLVRMQPLDLPPQRHGDNGKRGFARRPRQGYGASER